MKGLNFTSPRAITRQLAERLAGEPGFPARSETVRQAAVAAILRPVGNTLETLFIQRAVKQGDPWSGQMAFPGGHYEEGDTNLEETAVRETKEEIGVDLAGCSEFLGQMRHVEAAPRGRVQRMVVVPYVFWLTRDIQPHPDMREVVDVHWGRLDEMYSGASLTSGEFVTGGQVRPYQGYGVADQVVWGLGCRILDHFFASLDPDWVSHDDR